MQVVSASVTSVEDRGYAMSLGMKDVTGFLPRSAMNAGAWAANVLHAWVPCKSNYITRALCGVRLRRLADAPELVVGQVVIATVASVGAGGRAVSLTTKTGSVAKAAVGDAAAGVDGPTWFQADLELSDVPTEVAPNQLAHDAVLPFHALQAGLLVHARVKARFENGLQLAFLGLFEGTVNMFHLDLPQDGQAADLAAKYPDNHRVRGLCCGMAEPASHLTWLVRTPFLPI